MSENKTTSEWISGVEEEFPTWDESKTPSQNQESKTPSNSQESKTQSQDQESTPAAVEATRYDVSVEADNSVKVREVKSGEVTQNLDIEDVETTAVEQLATALNKVCKNWRNYYNYQHKFRTMSLLNWWMISTLHRNWLW